MQLSSLSLCRCSLQPCPMPILPKLYQAAIWRAQSPSWRGALTSPVIWSGSLMAVLSSVSCASVSPLTVQVVYSGQLNFNEKSLSSWLHVWCLSCLSLLFSLRLCREFAGDCVCELLRRQTAQTQDHSSRMRADVFRNLFDCHASFPHWPVGRSEQWTNILWVQSHFWHAT